MNKVLTFPEIESILLNCLPRPCIGDLHVPQVVSSFDNGQELAEINLKKNNYFYQLHADGIVSLYLDFKTQFGDHLLTTKRRQQRGKKFKRTFTNKAFN